MNSLIGYPAMFYRGISRLLLTLTVLALLPVAKATAEPPAASRPTTAPALTVAILDFDADMPANPTLGKQMGEMLAAALGNEPGFVLVDRATLARVLQEHELTMTGLVHPEDAIKVGHLVGAKILITGKAFTIGTKLAITAKLIGVETSLISGLWIKGKPNEDVDDLVTQLAGQLATRLREAGPGLVASTAVAEDPLPALKAKLATRKLPKLAIVASDQHIGPPIAVRVIDPPIDNELRTMFTNAGFTVVDADVKELAKAGVGVVVKAQGFSEYAARIGNMVSCTGRVELTVNQESDDKTLFSDSVTSRAADLSENIAGKTALQQASHELGLRLLSHLADTLPPADAGAATQPAK